ncbi:MAG: DUF2299 family protein [Candidatus Lokiarchaeota archaeon]|nr:DUF2299 family protein [Candidatus Lokiarchaeota archaeon]
MSESLNKLLKKYIENIGQLKETLDNPKLEFGYRFLYPHNKGRTFLVVKPKIKNCIEIQTLTKLSPQHVEVLEKYPKEKQNILFFQIAEFLINNKVHHILNFKDKLYILIDNIFILDEKDIPTINEFKDRIKYLYYTNLQSIKIVIDFCQIKGDSLEKGDSLRIDWE